MPTAAESMPLADYLVSQGVDPAKAAEMGAQGEAISKNRGLGLRESAHPAAQEFLRQSTPPETTAAVQAHETAELNAHLGQVYQPPASPLDYQFPHSIAPETDEAIAADNELRAAFHAEGLPRQIVESIGADLATAAHSRTNETAEQAQSRTASTRSTLERWYGKDTEANLRLVDSIFDRLLAKGGATREFVEAVAPHLDALSLDSLIQFAKHRAGAR